MPIDRVAEWREFSQQMEEYIAENTIEKYESNGIDLMSLTYNPVICVFCILKYAWRIWNNHMKSQDLFKIAHYAAIAWKLSQGKIIKTREDEKVPFKVLSTRKIAEC